MPIIKLTRGYEAIVDPPDMELLSCYKWCAHVSSDGNVYAKSGSGRGRRGSPILMHTLLMNPPKGMTVDHKNLNGLDNQRENLRLATRLQQSHNQPLRKGNQSGIKGVGWSQISSMWRARIRVNGKDVFLGLFRDKEEAGRAYREAAVKHFGDFARFQ